VTSSNARAFMRSLPHRQKVSWKSIVPEASEKALDLLDRMLTFDPGRRISGRAALRCEDKIKKFSIEQTLRHKGSISYDNIIS
jgi:hypothetical protein